MSHLIKKAATEAYKYLDECASLNFDDNLHDLEMYLNPGMSEVSDNEALQMIKFLIEANDKLNENLKKSADWILAIKEQK